jgi:hypothetical protein
MEEFRTIKGFENYQVSNLGNVKSLNFYRRKKETILKKCLDTDGYYRVGLYSNKKYYNRQVHQLVAISFLNHNPNGSKLVVNHKNFIRIDNRLENLEIITQRENVNQKHLPSTSKYTGVCWNKNSKKWHSQIIINKKRVHLGFFINEIDASNAYQKALFNLKNETFCTIQ